MQVIRQTSFTGISGLEIANLPQQQPTATEIKIQTAYTPVLPWDWRSATGNLTSLNPARPPYVPSYGLTGIVTDAGRLRQQSLIGQRVLTVNFHGSAREQNLLRPSPLLLPIPKRVSLAAATTLIGGADAAIKLISAAHIRPGMTVIITGAAGGVGTYLVQLSHQLGANVIALTRPSNRTWLQELGATATIDYTTALTPQLTTIPNDTRLLDTVGNPDLLNRLAANRPQLQVYSLALPQWQPLLTTQSFHFISGPIWPRTYRQLLDQLATGELKAAIAETVNFHDVRQAYHTAQLPGRRGRTLLAYSSSN
ncbi:NADP-dependent oxidoreductase [Lactiplantibacillus nangangensis]|uniref:NADP-dependent oxidoreductase n=1 Tax=Lactiplantibacillus nangangensis TaxID=2559917 RepID=A0ABW1SHZ9_9LACO|nr:NADP-dependent oxidoreductase [Lactiplantibacillus nangangensis]